jgi:hypothetical protein
MFSEVYPPNGGLEKMLLPYSSLFEQLRIIETRSVIESAERLYVYDLFEQINQFANNLKSSLNLYYIRKRSYKVSFLNQFIAIKSFASFS